MTPAGQAPLPSSPDPRSPALASDFNFHHSPFTVHYFGALPSTQTFARELVREGRDLHGVVLWAGEQTAGYGRTGRAWSSPPGGLYVTVGLPAGRLPAPLLGWLPILAAVACAEEIEARFGLRPAVKWPNDVLIDGRKLAGLIGDALPGAGGEVYLIGMGLNWANPAPQVEIPTASLKDLAGEAVGMDSMVSMNPATAAAPIPPTPRRDFLLAWLDRLGRSHGSLLEHGEAAAETLRQNAEARLWRRGQAVRLDRTEHGPVQGVLVGLGPGGAAMLRQGEETRVVFCGHAATEACP